MKMTLEITEINEARAILAAICGGEWPVTSAQAPGTTPVTSTPVSATSPAQPPVSATSPAQPPAPATTPAQPPAPATAPPPTEAVPTSAPTYTADQIMRAGAVLMNNDKQDELLALLKQFGVPSIQHLPPERYGAFVTAMRGLGAQI